MIYLGYEAEFHCAAVATGGDMAKNNWLVGWLRESDAEVPMINDIAVRIRAGILLAIPLYMGYTLLQAIYGSPWVVTGNGVVDTFDTDMSGRILYQVEAVRRTFDYSLQTKILWYALFEMLIGMSIRTAIFSPTIWLSKFLASYRAPEWKLLAPKRFAWSFGALMISICLVFFNPDTFAEWVNYITHTSLLPTTSNYMPRWIPNVLVFICTSFMWMEAILGFCAGCYLYRLAVKLGYITEPCDACNNLTSRSRKI